MTPFDAARRVVRDGVAAQVFPAAALEVGSSAGPLWSEAMGTLAFDAAAPPASADTLFDLASLTKVIATTSVVMELVRTGALRLDEEVSAFFQDWRGVDREHVTIRDLLEHASGLPARLVDPPPATRREFEHEISRIRLEYEPRTQAIYSDLGFILLAFLAADRGGAALNDLFDRIMSVRGLRRPASAPTIVDGAAAPPVRSAEREGWQTARDPTTVRVRPEISYGVPAGIRHLTAPTRPMEEDSRRGRVLAGEVHDPYAAALGGIAGHAGLFGTAPSVGAFARVVLRAARGAPDDVDLPPPFSPPLVADFTARSNVPGSSRALGWDTMLPTSSCGGHMSPRAFGQVGFTGTSLWIDPARDRYFVLLTNRVCDGGTLDDMRAVRRAFHDALRDV